MSAWVMGREFQTIATVEEASELVNKSGDNYTETGFIHQRILYHVHGRSACDPHHSLMGRAVTSVSRVRTWRPREAQLVP